MSNDTDKFLLQELNKYVAYKEKYEKIKKLLKQIEKILNEHKND